MIRTRRFVLGLLLAGAALSLAGEKPEAISESEIKALIDQLVSPNPKPILLDKGRETGKFGLEFRVPKGFDREKQKKVLEARAKLREIGPQAFPFLIARWKDERYCTTVGNDLSGVYYNLSVEHVCGDIIRTQIQPYGYYPAGGDDPRGKPYRPTYPAKGLYAEKDVREWWEKNKTKTLYQMQMEALDWVIAEEAKRPGDFTDEERKALQTIRKKLVDSGKSLPAGFWGPDDYEVRGIAP
jgi:hypothetical protein